MLPFKLNIKLGLNTKSSKPRKPRTKKETNIVDKSVMGTIVDSSTGEMVVYAADKFYPISKDSITTKGRRMIYRRDDNGRWYQWDRTAVHDRIEQPAYTPWKTKHGVKGDIVIEDNIEKFKVKVCWNKNNVDEYEAAMQQLAEMNNAESNG